jgi:hypothetical protein
MPNRKGILNLANWSSQKSVAARIGYSQQRPMVIPTQHELEALMVNPTPEIVVSWDCDAGITWLYKHSGSKDPNGRGFDLRGNTQIMGDFLTDHYTDVRKCLTGAIGVYDLGGPVASQHGIVFLEADGQPENPWVWSMGSAIGPLRLRLSDENASHPGVSLTWLSVGGL